MSFTDDSGNICIAATIVVAGFIGVATQFVCGVVENILRGETGSDLFKNTGTWGDYITAFATGALCAIPGVNTVVPVACDIAMPAVQQGIDIAVYGGKWNTTKYLEDVVTNFVSDAISSAVSIDSPKYIRDIKNDAVSEGIKGTRQLTSYLKKAQKVASVGNKAISALSSISTTVYKKATGKLWSKILEWF